MDIILFMFRSCGGPITLSAFGNFRGSGKFLKPDAAKITQGVTVDHAVVTENEKP
jgi:hypothetical protein